MTQTDEYKEKTPRRPCLPPGSQWKKHNGSVGILVGRRSGYNQRSCGSIKEKTEREKNVHVSLSCRRPGLTQKMDSRPAHLQIQVHHVVPVQEGHAAQDLPGQPDHILLREGFVVVGDTLVEDLATGGAAGTGRGKRGKGERREELKENCEQQKAG